MRARQLDQTKLYGIIHLTGQFFWGGRAGDRQRDDTRKREGEGVSGRGGWVSREMRGRMGRDLRKGVMRSENTEGWLEY